MGLDVIIGEIEEPFGLEPNDLALNGMCRMIEATLLELANLPLPVYPEEGKSHIMD
jgi:putative membrane protein